MVAEIIAVIAVKTIIVSAMQALLLQEAEQHAELIVDLLDQAHVGGDDGAPHLVAARNSGRRAGHEGAIDRMRIAPFARRIAAAGITPSAPYMSLYGAGAM